MGSLGEATVPQQHLVSLMPLRSVRRSDERSLTGRCRYLYLFPPRLKNNYVNICQLWRREVRLEPVGVPGFHRR